MFLSGLITGNMLWGYRLPQKIESFANTFFFFYHFSSYLGWSFGAIGGRVRDPLRCCVASILIVFFGRVGSSTCSASSAYSPLVSSIGLTFVVLGRISYDSSEKTGTKAIRISSSCSVIWSSPKTSCNLLNFSSGSGSVFYFSIVSTYTWSLAFILALSFCFEMTEC